MTRPEEPGEGADTARLLDEASHGNREAMVALLERCLPDLRAYVRLNAGPLIRAKESSSDLVQSVCLEILANPVGFRFEGEPSFKRWLFTAALRKIYDRHKYYRADKRDARREVAPDGGAGASVSDARVLERYGRLCSPSRRAMHHEEMHRVERSFDALPPEFREVITLARLVGLSHAEIAAQTGRTEDACRQLLSRGLARLATLVARQERKDGRAP